MTIVNKLSDEHGDVYGEYDNECSDKYSDDIHSYKASIF